MAISGTFKLRQKLPFPGLIQRDDNPVGAVGHEHQLSSGLVSGRDEISPLSIARLAEVFQSHEELASMSVIAGLLHEQVLQITHWAVELAATGSSHRAGIVHTALTEPGRQTNALLIHRAGLQRDEHRHGEQCEGDVVFEEHFVRGWKWEVINKSGSGKQRDLEDCISGSEFENMELFRLFPARFTIRE